jgi:peptide/nickel transport system permease protein
MAAAATPAPRRAARQRASAAAVALRGNPKLLVGLVIVAVVAVVALLAPLLAPYDPERTFADAPLQPPSRAHLLGTDTTGLDILSRLIYAPRIDITLAVVAAALAILIGVPLGLMSGYYRNWGSAAVMRVSDILQSFPVFILGMALVVLSGQNVVNIVVAIAVVQAPIYARLARSQSVHLKERAFIEAARANGLSDRAIIFRHLLPNAAGPLIAMTSVTIGTAMILTSGLSFVGAGVRVPTPEWGSMISIGTPSLIESGAWWASVPPGVALALTVMGFSMVGDALSELSDPRRRLR